MCPNLWVTNHVKNVEAVTTSLDMMMEVAFVLAAITTSVLLTPQAVTWGVLQTNLLNGKSGL